MTTRPGSGLEREDIDVGVRSTTLLGDGCSRKTNGHYRHRQLVFHSDYDQREERKSPACFFVKMALVTWQFSDPMEVPVDAFAYSDPDGRKR